LAAAPSRTLEARGLVIETLARRKTP